MAGLSKGYAVQLHFYNIANIIPKNFETLPYSQQAQILQTVFDKADVKVQCDCGAFYWQGMFEEDDKKDNTYSPFTGQQGKDIWANRHDSSGNVRGQQLCKHLWAAIEDLDKEIPNILKQLGGAQTATSSAASTSQEDTLEAPEQPAGLPDERTQSQGGIKSEKAADAVSADIDEVQSTSEQNDLPVMDTSTVEAKPVEAETEAAEGPQEAEPPIEEPNVAVKNNEEAEEIANNEPLEDTRKEVGLMESIYRRALQESNRPKTKYFAPEMDWEDFPDIDPEDRYRVWTDCVRAKLPHKSGLIPIGRLRQDMDGDGDEPYDWSQFDDIEGGDTFNCDPIDVCEWNGYYCIMDGHHRAAYAYHNDFLDIRANIYYVSNLQEAKDEAYWMNVYSKTEPYSKENIEAINELKKLRNEKKVPKPPKKRKQYLGDCRELGINDDLPWEDETECAQDMGYYARLDDFDGGPEDSNFEEISRDQLWAACDVPVQLMKGFPGWEPIYLKRYDDSVYVIYDTADDIHYFFA